MRAAASAHQRPGRPATRKDRHGRSVPVRAGRDVPLKVFFENVPSVGLDEALLMSGDSRFYRLYDALHDDAYKRTSPATLCRRFGVSLQDLFDLWAQHHTRLGMMRAATHLPQILEDVAKAALSREGVCPRCDAIGSVTDGETSRLCPVCEGIGKVLLSGNAHAIRLFFAVAIRTGR